MELYLISISAYNDNNVFVVDNFAFAVDACADVACYLLLAFFLLLLTLMSLLKLLLIVIVWIFAVVIIVGTDADDAVVVYKI